MGKLRKITMPSLKMLHRIPKLNNALAVLSKQYLALHEVPNYDMATNGERWLIRHLSESLPIKTVFDIGANHGSWTQELLRSSSDAEIHCFELCQSTFEQLSKNLAAVPQAKLNAFGLSNEEAQVSFDYNVGGDGQTSMIKVTYPKKLEMMTGRVRKGADYCKEQGLSRIDLMKIDVEGAEHLVLEGFGDWIHPQKTSVIQFEYGQVNIISKFLLYDFYEYFTNRGYVIGLLHPDHVEFRDYRYHQENFHGANYIATSAPIAQSLSK